VQWSTILGSIAEAWSALFGRADPAQGTPGSAFILIVGHPPHDRFDLNQRSRVIDPAPWVAEIGRAANDILFR
jgi:hypothetical protein